MAKLSRETATTTEHGPVTERAGDLHGYTVGFVEFHEDIDATPLLKGLPDDRCQCPHWGYVIKGRLTFRFGDELEDYEAGDAFYQPPGHIPVSHEPGTEIVMFSPAEALKETEEAMQRNMKALMGAG